MKDYRTNNFVRKSNMNTISYTLTDNTITVYDEDFVPVSIDSSHPNYHLVLSYLGYGVGELDYVLDLMKPITKVKTAVAGTAITVTNDAVFYNGKPLHGALIDRILGGDKVDNLVQFLGNLMENPSNRAVNELYLFLERNKHAITKDGYFVAYKIVNSEYRDLYTRSFDNSPGTVVTVSRNEVDEDPNRTCSKGLHVCGFEYLSSYGSVRHGTDRVVSVKINPRDVVAVPTDYNNAKMRVCGYVVLADITNKVKDTIGTTVGSSMLDYNQYLNEYGYSRDEDAEDLYNNGEWVEHDGLCMPFWVYPQDKVEVVWNHDIGDSFTCEAKHVVGWDSKVTHYRKVM